MKMLAEDTVGSEVLLEREPDHVNLRNDAARLYLALGQPARALAHFERVSTLQPANAAAAVQCGHRARGAATRRRCRSALSGRVAPRRELLAGAQQSRGVVAAKRPARRGRPAFERAVATDPRNADARANLGLMLIAAAQPDAGLAQIRQALDDQAGAAGGADCRTPGYSRRMPNRERRRPADALALASTNQRRRAGSRRRARSARREPCGTQATSTPPYRSRARPSRPRPPLVPNSAARSWSGSRSTAAAALTSCRASWCQAPIRTSSRSPGWCLAPSGLRRPGLVGAWHRSGLGDSDAAQKVSCIPNFM